MYNLKLNKITLIDQLGTEHNTFYAFIDGIFGTKLIFHFILAALVHQTHRTRQTQNTHWHTVMAELPISLSTTHFSSKCEWNNYRLHTGNFRSCNAVKRAATSHLPMTTPLVANLNSQRIFFCTFIFNFRIYEPFSQNLPDFWGYQPHYSFPIA